ncbi:cytochrome C oxidase subunit IV family protein [Alicyclobacillus cycloheptanicus]|uniref:Cytochrome o ubiquinol oxidase operon protein cyoD n=1 Tax=Alicyclobacillus cycloheptanicus TaxID=1457 RepID=A0ABT9XL63_9BACL|nr:cytochrome C oxidase subunit IV family protein [Alicyclobacillus cycloheptanicus]MDQ0191050.1 cytochrome o ubiquinol oxidase operon protein cyoD [Alicyclobacillus cycloheptanicus]WDM00846.1 cytochrome C oxidase subunit IV family protein [Alicyclobacillus cycloheptanicus]
MAAQNGVTRSPGHQKHKATQYIIGYLSSLILTAIAFTLALTHSMRVGPLVVLLTILAGLQVVVQLYFFMHITEGDGPPYHAVFLVLGLLFTFAIALMSIWIMGFPAFMAQVA